ncbi:uncharacterized protein [Panulirus ornatus]|uniref:uncharacterized protein isoform X2 n=1 Tax=Panulirus ornatus TaxID=150431 RepID=UPI003A87E3E1
MSEDRREDILRESILLTQEKLRKTLGLAELKFEELGILFIDEGVQVLCEGIGIYAELFKRTGLQDREALENAISKSHNVVKEAALELLNVENDWGEFLGMIEANEIGKKDTELPKIGDKIPSNFILTYVGGGTPTNVDSYYPSYGSSATKDATLTAETSSAFSLGDILTAEKGVTLMVLNRHFA